MRKILRGVLVICMTGLLWGCYPEGPDYYSDYDIVYTNYDVAYDYSVNTTYFIPDKIVKITGAINDGDPLEYVSAAYAVPMLEKMKSNMAAMGYTYTSNSSAADLVLMPSAMEVTNISYYYDYWWSYWGYGWYYPYPVTYSYKTGSLFMNLVDTHDVSPDGKAHIVWTSIVNGLLEGSSTDFTSRMTKSIDQAFKQSAYLKQ